MDFSVIVVTHSRARMLGETLASLSRLEYPLPWEVLVVDNNSTDSTRDVVQEMTAGFPVPLRYVFEPAPGKYIGLNTGIRAASGRLIAATDDDALPEPDWLERAADGLARYQCDFVGGRVRPIWGGTPPRWADGHSSIVGKVLGLQEHGAHAREYGRAGLSWPLGVNVAYRRSAFDRAGLFDGRLGRVAGTLRNQSQREWHLRARAAGLRGMYLPDMVVHHCVEAERLTRRYFYRWFYWHGISRAVMNQTTGLHLLEPESGRTHARERHVLGMPVSLWRQGARSLVSAAKRQGLGRSDEALEYELMVCFCAGVLRERLRGRSAAAPATSVAQTARRETLPLAVDAAKPQAD